MPVVIEVVARIGDSIVDVAYLAPGETYHLGTAELATPSTPAFTSSTQQAGLVAVTMTRGFRVEAPVPRKPFDPRPLIYSFASLALHLAIVIAAMRFERLERLVARPEPPRYRYAHVFHEPEPDAASPASAVQPRSPGAKHDPGRERRRARVAAQGLTGDVAIHDAGSAIAGLVKSMDFVKPDMLDDLGPVVDPNAVEEQGFGGHRWNIDDDPAFATIKTPDGYDLTELADMASLYGMTPEQKAKRRIEIQTALARKSAARGDCVPSHRIAKWLPRVDRQLYKSIYLADPDIAYCLTQPAPPAFIKATPYQQAPAPKNEDAPPPRTANVQPSRAPRQAAQAATAP